MQIGLKYDILIYFNIGSMYIMHFYRYKQGKLVADFINKLHKFVVQVTETNYHIVCKIIWKYMTIKDIFNSDLQCYLCILNHPELFVVVMYVWWQQEICANHYSKVMHIYVCIQKIAEQCTYMYDITCTCRHVRM